jgi:small subunit ribosomal protein S3
MSVVKHFIEDSIKKAEIDEFLRNEFERAGYGGVSITKTPLGTHLVIYTMRPGLVIGRGGETIRALASILEEKFQLPSPQISVAEIEIPELNAYVVASRIASALKRGVHYRRAGFWGLRQAMEAGALGVEVIISGKLRTDRARYEKFREGYLPKSGEPPRKYMRKAELHVQTKPGILGVKVRLIPPDAEFPDQVKVQIIEEELETEPVREIVEKKVAAKEEVTEPEVLPVEEKVVVEEKAAEPEKPKVAEPAAAPVKEKAVTEKKVAEPEALPVEEKTVTKETVAEPEVTPAKPKKTTKKKATKKKVAKAKAPAKKPAAKKKAEKKAAKPKVTAKKKAAPKKKAAKPAVSAVKEKAAPKKKTAKPKKAAPAKKKTASKKKVTKAKAPSAKKEKKKEAGE